MSVRFSLCVLLAIVTAGAAAGCAPVGSGPSGGSDPPSSGAPSTWPSAMIVLGHSGATGYDSDPAHPGEDAKTNSWATGTNPRVDSVYLRALAQSPALKNNVTNFAISGSDVDDLPDQVGQAVRQGPLPDLVIIQSVDNDVRCDGTDEANYAPYGGKITAVLRSIVTAAPQARIYVVGQWATSQNYADVLATRPELVAQNEGGGICDLFDASGQERPGAIAASQQIADQYGDVLRSSCAGFPTCSYGGDEMRNMVITADDLGPDGSHLTIGGLHKMAGVAWPHIEDLNSRT